MLINKELLGYIKMLSSSNMEDVELACYILTDNIEWDYNRVTCDNMQEMCLKVISRKPKYIYENNPTYKFAIVHDNRFDALAKKCTGIINEINNKKKNHFEGYGEYVNK